MATKAEQHRADQQVANRVPRAKKAPPRRGPVDGARQGDNHNADLKGTALRNLKTAPSHQKGGPALEDSESGKPSRKSTRGSAGHVKQATNLQRREIRRTHSSKARALGARGH
jgi:hypothetical protein